MARMRKGLGRGGVAGILATLTAGAAAAQVLPNPMDLGRSYEIFAFEAPDTNGDNVISEAEFVRDAAAAFAGLDRNRDGRLSPAELGPHDAHRFKAIDANGDGVLTFSEIMGFKMEAFRTADVDRDGHLSFDEMVNAVRAEVGQ